MSLLVSLSQMKARLRIDTSSADTDYTLLLTQAQTLVLDYLRQRYDDGTWASTVNGWTSSTVPDQVRDRKSTRLNSSHSQQSRMPSSA